jgi:hypothetical protein
VMRCWVVREMTVLWVWVKRWVVCLEEEPPPLRSGLAAIFNRFM